MRSALAFVLLLCGPFLLTGTALPVRWGLAAPLLVLGGLHGVWGWRGYRSHHRSPDEPWPESLRPLDDVRRVVLLGLTWFPCVLLAALAAVGAAGALVAFPAAIWVLLALVVAVVILARLSSPRGRTFGALVLAALIPIVAMAGAAFESGGPDSRGWAHSGRIHGTHPFQSTAVIVDGHGPFDIGLNDYVTAEGTRGYSPETLAPYLQGALHRLAELRFPDGPARARKGLAEAEVEAVQTGSIAETRHEPHRTEQLRRFVVRSGTYGWRSSVEFVCPGQRIDPRRREADPVMMNMCPTKYASEASAGIGVTGRWPGYAEVRGQSRATLANVFGWTRSEDRQGQRVLLHEQWLWAAGLLAIVVFAASRWPGIARGLTDLGGATILWGAMVVFVTSPWWLDPSPLGWFEWPAKWGAPTAAAWLPAVVVSAGLPFWMIESRRGWIHLRFVLPVLGTLGVASSPAIERWIIPSFAFEGDALPLERFVAGVASALAMTWDLDVQVVEALVAAGVIASCVGLLGGVTGLGRRVATEILAPSRSDPRSGAPAWGIVTAAIALPAMALVGSGAGARALPAAVATAAVLGSVFRKLDGGRAAVPWRIVHGIWLLVALVLLFEPFLHVPPPDTSLLVVTLIGVFLVAASALFMRSVAPGARDPAPIDPASATKRRATGQSNVLGGD